MMRWSNTKTYTEEDILRMQQEAVSRVHDMQARAQRISSSGFFEASGPSIGEVRPPSPPALIEAESRVLPDPEPPAEPEPEPAAQAPQSEPQPEPRMDQQQARHPAPQEQRAQMPADPISGMLEKLNIDSETLLILGLMFLLYNEKADNVLLMALGYLLL